MEIKKSKKASLKDLRGINLLMGLIVALALMFFFFEFTTFKTRIIEPVVKVTYTPTEEEIVPVTQPIITAAPPPPADIPPVAEIIEIVENDVEIEEKEISSPQKVLYNPKHKESPEHEDEYKGLMYQYPIINSQN